jgi:hypothetical protein
MKNPLILPQKGKGRRDAIGLATIFAIKIADDYIKQCASGDSNDLQKYLAYLQKIFVEKFKEINLKAKDGKWEVSFGEKDIYSLEGKKAQIAKDDAIERLISTAHFIKSCVALWWNERGDKSNNLKWFIEWLPRYTNKL